MEPADRGLVRHDAASRHRRGHHDALPRGPRGQRPSLGSALSRAAVPGHLHRRADALPRLQGSRRRTPGAGCSSSASATPPRDIAVETSSISERTFLSMRRGAHVIPKYFFGQPFDRLTKTPLARAPLWLQRLTLRVLLRVAQGRMTDYGLPKPDHKSSRPTRRSRRICSTGSATATSPSNPTWSAWTATGCGSPTARSNRSTRSSTAPATRSAFRSSTRSSSRRTTTRSPCSTASSTPTMPGCTSSDWSSRSARSCRSPRRSPNGSRTCLEGKAGLPTVDEARREISRYDRRTAKRYLASKRHTIEVDFLAYLRQIERERRRGARRAGSPWYPT